MADRPRPNPRRPITDVSCPSNPSSTQSSGLPPSPSASITSHPERYPARCRARRSLHGSGALRALPEPQAPCATHARSGTRKVAYDTDRSGTTRCGHRVVTCVTCVATCCGAFTDDHHRCRRNRHGSGRSGDGAGGCMARPRDRRPRCGPAFVLRRALLAARDRSHVHVVVATNCGALGARGRRVLPRPRRDSAIPGTGRAPGTQRAVSPRPHTLHHLRAGAMAREGDARREAAAPALEPSSADPASRRPAGGTRAVGRVHAGIGIARRAAPSSTAPGPRARSPGRAVRRCGVPAAALGGAPFAHPRRGALGTPVAVVTRTSPPGNALFTLPA